MTQNSPAVRTGLRGLGLAAAYDSEEGLLQKFYIPVLSRAVRYDRSVGFFTASAIAAAANGINRFVAHGGRMRLLIGTKLSDRDRQALIGATEIPPELAARLAAELVPADEVAARSLEVLAWLAKQGRLHVKVAVPVDEHGVPMPPAYAESYFHEKMGILYDTDDPSGNGVAFQGSANESNTAWSVNLESINVFTSWGPMAELFDYWAGKFEQRWRGEMRTFKVFDLPDPAVQALLQLAPDRPPPGCEPTPIASLPAPDLLARFLLVAPRLVGADGLAEATSGVRLMPHQTKVVSRLAGTYPRSWLLSDEVGLGKTISTGMALRRLLLEGQVKRALVLAPAGVCRQWQDALFEKFGLWVPRLDRGRIWGAHPDDVRPVTPGENPYATEPILLVSSHFARRADQRTLLLDAPGWDVLIVDEAHHARRQGANKEERRPSQLLTLLDRIAEKSKAKAVWLATATPMQTHPVELVDLLSHVGLSGPLRHLDIFERYYAELAKPDGTADWQFLASCAPQQTLDLGDRAVLADIRQEVGLLAAERIKRFGEHPEQTAETVSSLDVSGRRCLQQWLRQRGPINHHSTRHTRRTLRHYRDTGLLAEPIADRDVQAVPIQFTNEEQTLYEDLDNILDRLTQAYGTYRQAGFVLTIYRRRLTSSWAAIRSTLERRLDRHNTGLLLEEDTIEEADSSEIDSEETDTGTVVDDSQAIPLNASDLDELRSYLHRIKHVSDSKFERLTQDINIARGNHQRIIIFTAFTDTLTYLRDRLHPTYLAELATYTGEGGRIWRPDTGWKDVAKDVLIQTLQTGHISVVLATDAASEGLDLQAASYLVNFDLPWNPMKVEQRIGRIDRIGQTRPTVNIRNYVIPGTIEEDVYSRLAMRIDMFSGLVGQLQPILGATEAAYSQVFRVPLSERTQAREKAIQELERKAEELKKSGIDLDPDDDLWPVKDPHTPIELASFQQALEDLNVDLGTSERPVTSSPSAASRDPQSWRALATYGHPQLETALESIGGPGTSGQCHAAAFAQSDDIWAAYRTDRMPPSQIDTVAELVGLSTPIAADDAMVIATQVVHAAADIRRQQVERVTAQNDQTWLTAIQYQFIELVHRAIQIFVVMRMRHPNGTSAEPRAIWFELVSDQHSNWHNADAFRRHLELRLQDIIPTGIVISTDMRNDSQLTQISAEANQQLGKLITTWQSIHRVK